MSYQVDPYAYFLDSTSKRNYQARLAERGLPAQGLPDNGHAFELKKHTLHGALVNYQAWRTSNGVAGWSAYNNVFLHPSATTLASLNHIHGGSLLHPAPYQGAGLEGFAQGAYAKVAPTSVMFDASAFAGELREGLPNFLSFGKTFESFRDFGNSIGSGHLMAQFGLKPLLSDLHKAGKTLERATRQLAQQGQRVHRRLELPTTTLSDSRPFTGTLGVTGGANRGFVPVPSQALAPTSTFSTATSVSVEGVFSKERSTQRWFEGEFSFFYPLSFDPESYLSRLDVLMNSDFTVRTLWQLAPWSWMIDWFLDIESTMKANELAGNDHLIMHYGYAMETEVYKTKISWKRTSQLPSTITGIPSTGGLRSSTIYKRRLRANPYGFQVNPTGALTGDQLGILGALGLTKLK